MTGLVDRMERDGLVLREADPEDRRAQRVRLTEAGRQVREAVLEVVDHTLDRVLGGIGREEMEGMKTALRTVLANAEQERAR
jgi:DNA-binding MarR family transcriptional regulator